MSHGRRVQNRRRRVLYSAHGPDDGAVLFSSSRMDSMACVQYPTRAQPELYTVSLEGGMPRQALSTPAIYAVHDRAGKSLSTSCRFSLATFIIKPTFPSACRQERIISEMLSSFVFFQGSW